MFFFLRNTLLLKPSFFHLCKPKTYRKINGPVSLYFQICIYNDNGALWKNGLCGHRILLGNRRYSDNSDIKNKTKATKLPKDLEAFLQDKRIKIRNTEEKWKKSSNFILQDIKETKNKVKERVGEIIEKENVYTIPNFLCVSRIILSPYLGMLIVQANFNFALGILTVAAITDMLDGWIARTWESQSSKIGSFLDPVADKILIATLFISLTYAGLIPVVLTGIIITRDVILVIAGFIIRYKSLPPPKTLSRYFDFTHATAQLEPTLISKINTGVQLLLVGTTLAASVFHEISPLLLEYLWYITGTTTVAAGISYIVTKNTYRLLKNSKKS